ncbi:PorT family protein [Dysgonomonas sp. 216]|uniref:porin family protein n=1 Tax=Dysgonomonas sp. 216 TaxID=2302934 RepID=UPI0013D6CC9A|nr:porin family protein [Dysgonomonas sp. 216]NDW18999.1 PorT family protein [Dysgonomonas sp. 216]
MIKRTFIYFLFVVVCSINLIKAQSKFEPEWNVGIGFGPTFSTQSLIHQRAEIPAQNTQQFHGGLAIRYISEKNLGLIAELNYSQQGWEGKFKNNPEYAHKHSLNYIELPVLSHIYFGRKGRFFVNLGPKFQFLISEKEKISEALANDIDENSTPQYNRNAQHKFDYGIMGGVGFELRTGIGNFALEGRYYFGLGDIYKSGESADSFSRSANRVISAKLTYYIKAF